MRKLWETLLEVLGITPPPPPPPPPLRAGLAQMEATVNSLRKAGEVLTPATMTAVKAFAATIGVPITAKEEAEVEIYRSRDFANFQREALSSEIASLQSEVASLQAEIERVIADSTEQQESLKLAAAAQDKRASDLEILVGMM